MHNRNYGSPLLHSISTIIFILITSSTSFCDEGELFFHCITPFSCGEKFPEIFYPFWGGNKSRECGLPDFELKCQQDNHLTIDIGNQTFRVLSIDVPNPTLTIARDDLWDIHICPEKYQNTSINPSLFRLGPEVKNITLFYGCDDDAYMQGRNRFPCRINSNRTNGYFPEDSISASCQWNISVPVLERGLEEFISNRSFSLQELLNQGFSLEYNTESPACLACEKSHGQCWSGTNNSTSSTCLCTDGVHPYICSHRATSAAGVAIVIFLVLYCIKINKPQRRSTFPPFNRTSKEDMKIEAAIKQYGSPAPRRYSYSNIKKMTNSFKDKLGKGGYGDVYKGNLFDGRPVAVTILKTSKGSGEEFINEVASISRTSHVNIVALFGICLDGDKRALIYEFMPNGSLERYIHGQTKSKTCVHLGWAKLYQIALGIARGLEYLHRGCTMRILHFDIKPHNILLDEDFCPKISDFGLAKVCTRKDSIVSMVVARGTIGYIAPEVISRVFGGVSHKSDVYSYGMMLLEMVGGRKNISVEVSHASEIYFPHWVYQRMVLDEDLKLQGEMTPEEDDIARKMILVGLWCIQTDPSQRPAVSKVIEMLTGSLQALEIPPKPFFGSPSRSPQGSSTTIVWS